MSLIECPECKIEVSDQARSCPKRGRKITMSEGYNFLLWVAAIIGAIVVGIFLTFVLFA